MNKCLFCNNYTTRPRYCTSKCIKRAWYCRKHPESFFSSSQKFWLSNTGKGFTWEKYVAKLIGANHLEFNKYGADLDWGGLSVDVKSSNIYKRKNKRGKPVTRKQTGCWVFNRGKDKPIDFFSCVCLIDNKVIKILMIPSEKFGKAGCVIGKKSKFDEYQINH